MQTFLLLYPHTTIYRHYPICKRLGVVHIIENFVLEQGEEKQNTNNNNLSVVFNHQTSNEILYTIRILWIGDWERNEPVVGGLCFF